ncbi:hypothetical protein Vafri_21371, partial [Volvox africanus]
MWRILIVLALNLLRLGAVGATTLDARQMLIQQLAEKEQQINQRSSFKGPERRIIAATTALDNPLDTTLGVPADLRWVAPNLKLLIFIVDMCKKGGGPVTS